MYDSKNRDIAISMGEDEVTVINSNEIIAKILVQTSRQNGLTTVYNEILSFAGNEIYCIEEEALYGKTFIESIFEFPTCVPIGIQKKYLIDLVLVGSINNILYN